MRSCILEIYGHWTIAISYDCHFSIKYRDMNFQPHRVQIWMCLRPPIVPGLLERLSYADYYYWCFVQVWFIVKFSQRSYQYIWDLVHVKHHIEHLSAKFSHMSWIYIDWHRIVYGNFNNWCPGYNNEPTLEASCDM